VKLLGAFVIVPVLDDVNTIALRTAVHFDFYDHGIPPQDDKELYHNQSKFATTGSNWLKLFESIQERLYYLAFSILHRIELVETNIARERNVPYVVFQYPASDRIG
jgi:hypothetical protein